MSLQDRLLKYSVHGATFSGIAAWSTSDSRSNSFFSSKATLSFSDLQVPTWAFSFAVGFLSSAVVDLSSSYILPYVSADDKMKNRESAILSVSVGAASAYAMMSLLAPAAVPQFGTWNILGAGGLSEALALYLTSFLNGASVQGY